VKIKVPVKFITGELDMVYTSLNMKEYIHGGGFKEDVPNLEEVIVQLSASSDIIKKRMNVEECRRYRVVKHSATI